MLLHLIIDITLHSKPRTYLNIIQNFRCNNKLYLKLHTIKCNYIEKITRINDEYYNYHEGIYETLHFNNYVLHYGTQIINGYIKKELLIDFNKKNNYVLQCHLINKSFYQNKTIINKMFPNNNYDPRFLIFERYRNKYIERHRNNRYNYIKLDDKSILKKRIEKSYKNLGNFFTIKNIKLIKNKIIRLSRN